MQKNRKHATRAIALDADSGLLAQSEVLRNRACTGLVPEVDLIAPDLNCPFLSRRPSRQSVLKSTARPSSRASVLRLPIPTHIIPMFTARIRHSEEPLSVRFDCRSSGLRQDLSCSSRYISLVTFARIFFAPKRGNICNFTGFKENRRVSPLTLESFNVYTFVYADEYFY